MARFIEKLFKGILLALFGFVCTFFGMSVQLAASKAYENEVDPDEMPRGPIGWLGQIGWYAKYHFDQWVNELNL